MRDRPECEATRALAAELALGVVVGEERARAVQHLETCTSCRREVAEFAEVKDGLLLLAGEQPPPLGFESRVLASLDSLKTPPRRRWRRVRLIAAAAAVAAVVAAVGTGVGVYKATESDRDVAGQLRRALDRADGQYFGVEFLEGAGGERAGHVFVYRGTPSWVFAFVEPGRSGAFDVEIRTRDGGRQQLGPVELSTERNGAGVVLPVNLEEVALVRLVPENGGETLEAEIPGPPGR